MPQEKNKEKIIILNTMTIGMMSAYKVKNSEIMMKINSLLTLDNYEMRKKMIEWKSEIMSNNQSYEKLQREISNNISEAGLDIVIKNEIIPEIKNEWSCK